MRGPQPSRPKAETSPFGEDVHRVPVGGRTEEIIPALSGRFVGRFLRQRSPQRIKRADSRTSILNSSCPRKKAIAIKSDYPII